jgi:hypothetical protein
LFFSASNDFKLRLTELYDFVNALRAAMPYLASALEPRAATTPDDRELAVEFSPAEDVTGQNLRKFAEMRAGDRERELAGMWLFSAIALYERWSETIEPVSEAHRPCLQWPPRGTTPKSTKPGVDVAISWALQRPAPAMEHAFGASLRGHPDFVPSDLSEYLLLFRAYKVVRNAIAHSGRYADAYTEAVVGEAAATAAALHTDRHGLALPLPAVANGLPVELDLAQVKFLLVVLHRIVFTVDAIYMLSAEGQDELLLRWRKVHGSERRVLPGEPARRRAFIRGRLQTLRVPPDVETEELFTVLRDARLVF